MLEDINVSAIAASMAQAEAVDDHIQLHPHLSSSAKQLRGPCVAVFSLKCFL